MELQNPFGLGTGDGIELALASLLVLIVILWPRFAEPAYRWFTGRTALCLIVLAAVPVAGRLALLPKHPLPVPETAEQFRQALSAETLAHFRVANPPHAFAEFFETDRSVHGLGNNWFLILCGLGAVAPAVFWLVSGVAEPGTAFALAMGALPVPLSDSPVGILWAAALVAAGWVVRLRPLKSRLRIPPKLLGILVCICAALQGYWFAEAWAHPARVTVRREMTRRLEQMPGTVLVFVRGELHGADWVHNATDIDGARIVYAFDRGEAENARLRKYFSGRKVLLLESDRVPPVLGEYRTAPPVAPQTTPETQPAPEPKDIIPGLRLEQVR